MVMIKRDLNAYFAGNCNKPTISNFNREPLWLTKIHNTIITLERWINNLKQDKEQYDLITEFINTGRLEQEPKALQQQILSQYDKYKTHDYDKEINHLEEDLNMWRKKYKEAQVKYKIWEIDKDFK